MSGVCYRGRSTLYLVRLIFWPIRRISTHRNRLPRRMSEQTNLAAALKVICPVSLLKLTGHGRVVSDYVHRSLAILKGLILDHFHIKIEKYQTQGIIFLF